MPKSIIFDWDGTLAQTRNAVVYAMEYILKKYNKAPWDITKNKYRDPKKSLKENFPNFFQSQAQQAYTDYLEYYTTHCSEKITPTPQAQEFLLYCIQNQIELYIISNKEKSLLLKEVHLCFPNIKFKKILGNGDSSQNKPSASPVFAALQNAPYSINSSNIWLIGDTSQDTECAQNAGILPILLNPKQPSQNIHQQNSTISQPLTFQSFAEIKSYLQKHLNPNIN